MKFVRSAVCIVAASFLVGPTAIGPVSIGPVAFGQEASSGAAKQLTESQLTNIKARVERSLKAATEAMDLSDDQQSLLKKALEEKFKATAAKVGLDTPNDERRAVWKESNRSFVKALSGQFSKQDIQSIHRQIQDANNAGRIFNGKDLDGWEQVNGTATYEVIDGEIVGTTATGSPNSFLATKKTYSDFDLQFEVFLVHNELNSGVQFRSNQHTEETLAGIKKKHPVGRVFGYQCELEASAEGDLDPIKYGDAGYIYDEARRGWIVDEETRMNAKTRGAFRNQKWNRIRIRAEGDHIQTWINGRKISDLHDDETKSGFIALQVHGIGERDDKWQVKWRNIRVRELP